MRMRMRMCVRTDRCDGPKPPRPPQREAVEATAEEGDATAPALPHIAKPRLFGAGKAAPRFVAELSAIYTTRPSNSSGGGGLAVNRVTVVLHPPPSKFCLARRTDEGSFFPIWSLERPFFCFF